MILPRISRVLIALVLFIGVGFFQKPIYAQTATATPTNTPTSTPTNTPSPTPANTSPYCASLTSDIKTATGTPQTVTFSCAGVDPSGLIMAAEFVFGDGTSKVVEKNVGSPGSISIAHTYTTIGTLGASCRVRDNDNQYSPSVEACKLIVTIRPGTKTPTTGANTTITPTPLVASSTATLTPTPTIDIQPTLYPEETLVASDTGSNNLWWILGGVISLILAFLLLRRRKSPKPPTATAPPTGPAVPPHAMPQAPVMPETPTPPPTPSV